MIAAMPLWQVENARFALQERPFYPLKCVFTKNAVNPIPPIPPILYGIINQTDTQLRVGKNISPISHPHLTHISPWLRKLSSALSVYWHRRMRMLHRTFLPGTVHIVWCRDSYYQHDSCVHPVLTQPIRTYRGASTSGEQSDDNQLLTPVTMRQLPSASLPHQAYARQRTTNEQPMNKQ